ncbi:hypothetical protein [Nonomuraea turcica]|uniref:hypothetical protein n=1 Tax=Nonomuraea sp. G32 TaxID=3067274 RepID=UPI00273CBCD6|nr:hypothetical protein [Nonomuraea sp. G32]MDP4512060.1 hypothetical protein [Nonomuraea sp. G32]
MLVGAAHLREGTRATYRSKLLRLREAVIGTGCATGKPVKLSADTASRPYTSAELAALWRGPAASRPPTCAEAAGCSSPWAGAAGSTRPR